MKKNLLGYRNYLNSMAYSLCTNHKKGGHMYLGKTKLKKSEETYFRISLLYVSVLLGCHLLISYL